MASLNPTQTKILEFLQAQAVAVPTLQIAKAVCGSAGTTKQVNPDLYAMEKLALISKETLRPNGGQPHWKIRAGEPQESKT